MDALLPVAMLIGVIVSIIMIVSIAKIADNTTAIRNMIKKEIERQKEKDKPTAPIDVTKK